MSRFSPLVRPTNSISTSTVANWFGNQFVNVPGNFDAIATVNAASGGSSSIEFTSIPSTYTHLQIRGIARTDRTGSPAQDALKLQFNSDTGTNYSHHYLSGNASSVSAGANTSSSGIFIDGISNNSAATGVFGAFVIDILDYKNTNKNKTLMALSGWDNNGVGIVWFESGMWLSTNAITSIKILPNTGPNFLQYSKFSLYGSKSA